MRLEPIGVYPVPEADEPCHLLEWRLTGHDGDFDVSMLRQPMPGEDVDNWQAPYDEYLLSPDGTAGEPVFGAPLQVSGEGRFCFFYFYLQPGIPFETPTGPMALPEPTVRPTRLAFVAYEAP